MAKRVRRGFSMPFLWAGGLALAGLAVAGAVAGLASTANDFRAPGTQPLGLVSALTTAANCANCHAYYGEEHNEPFTMWSTSMMGQAGRDPIFYACLAIANQDAAFAGEFCLRCHVPNGWVAGRSADPTGELLTGADFEGVSCAFCHRLVDPVYEAGVNPPEDEAILNALAVAGDLPVNPHSANYVIDPQNRRRGPYQLDPGMPHTALQSPFHRDSALCSTCHDISNPMFSRQQDGTYALNALDTPAPSHDKYQQFPIERTYSEWSMSSFAQGPIDMGGRFGGNDPLVSSCQDCHMPTASGYGAEPTFGPPFRNDLPRHYFNGANTWVLKSVRSLYPDGQTFLSPRLVDEAIERTLGMLDAASDMELTVEYNRLKVRIINQSGHKLPTGYSEGRRMWLNVAYNDANGNTFHQLGTYDDSTGDFDPTGTKVYEAKAGMDAAVAAATGNTPGESFHFVLNNEWLFDNRIPPRGFTNAGFASVQAEPKAYTYADGQHWDDTWFDLPPTATGVEVTLFYQITTKEYIEFLRDANTTNDKGQIAYDQWVLHGRSQPAILDNSWVDVSNRCISDADSDGDADSDDIILFFSKWEQGEGDFDGDFDADSDDIIVFFAAWDSGC